LAGGRAAFFFGALLGATTSIFGKTGAFAAGAGVSGVGVDGSAADGVSPLWPGT
jgi:hypothetical protein